MYTILFCAIFGFELTNGQSVDGEYIGTKDGGKIVLIKNNEEIKEYQIDQFNIQSKKEFAKLNRFKKAEENKIKNQKVEEEKKKKEEEEIRKSIEESKETQEKLFPVDEGVNVWNITILEKLVKQVEESKNKEKLEEAFFYLRKIVVEHAINYNQRYPERDFIIIKRDKIDIWINVLLSGEAYHLQIKSYTSQDSGKIRTWGEIYKELEQKYDN